MIFIKSYCYNEYTNDIFKPNKTIYYETILKNANFKITDNSNQPMKFVFYSPSITTGIDISIEDKQDVFIYINGQSIDPTQAFQLTTRCRNINKLFYYSESKSNEPKYKSVVEVEKLYSEFIETSDKFNEVCKTINMDYEEVISTNDFYKLYFYNEYTNDIFKPNKTIDYETI